VFDFFFFGFSKFISTDITTKCLWLDRERKNFENDLSLVSKDGEYMYLQIEMSHPHGRT
jgi:hypothetical protein